MKIPLTYPKIPDTTGCELKKCVVYEKYDGTNLHWDFNGSTWVSFGTRRDTFPFTPQGFEDFAKAHPGLESAPQLFDTDDTLQESMFCHYSGLKLTLFTEFLGPKSFAGQHTPGDTMEHIIIDVMKGKRLLKPDEFVDLFGGTEWNVKGGWDKFNVAKLLYMGKYSGQLVEDIRHGKYPVKEGAIIKGLIGSQVYMAKVKTNAYMDRLKNEFKDTWQDYWE